MHSQIAIVGAGLAGLHAAHLLRRAGIDHLLLEARHRPGGRIHTVNAEGRDAMDGFDLGPSWFWPQMQPAIADLVTELGLAAFPQASDGDVLFERMSREGPQRFRGMAQEPVSFRLVGGTSALVRALTCDIPASVLQLGAPVTEMALVDRGVALTVRRDTGVQDVITAERVIVAMPPRLLEATVRFTPAQDATTQARWRNTATWMAPHAKFFAIYDRPFWREAGLSGTAQSMVGPMPEIHDATSASGEAALFGFIGTPAAQRATLGEAAVSAACVAQLGRLFGPDASTPRATLIKDWASDAQTATTADQLAGGHPVSHDSPWVSGAWAERLLLAGSETSPSEPGYLSGAVTAAERAVARLLAARHA